MAISFTPEQEQVITLRNSNILVSAAAGSGKTAVLVERIVRMVCDEAHPVDIDRLLIVTFTNAAAAEMRERIANGIAARLAEHPESEHIQKQSTLLHNAQITTIDSFCLFLIRNHFQEIGLDPAFRVADEGEIKLLQQEVLAALMEDQHAQGSPEFLACVEYFCYGGRETTLENHILELSRCAASYPWSEEWLEERGRDYEARGIEGLLDNPCGDYLERFLTRMLEGCTERLRRVRALCDMPDGPYMYGETVEQELDGLEAILRYRARRDAGGAAPCAEIRRAILDYSERIPTFPFGRLPGKKDDSVNAAKKELAKELRAQVKEILGKLSTAFFATPLELAAQQAEKSGGAVRELLELTREFDRRMLAEKQERRIIDFSDMEHYALQILLRRECVREEQPDGTVRERIVTKPSPVALEYRDYFYEILIDEYQDSNLVQEYLLTAVSGGENGRYNRFMVGDVKQSIYRFRLARPELFLEKYKSYGAEGEHRRIDLARNFRSRTQVVNSVNSVFSRLMSRETGGIEYDDRAALYAGAVYPDDADCDNASDLLLIDTDDGAEEARVAEARAVAVRIKELLADFKVTDKATGELRPVRFSDMVILLRSPSGWDEVFRDTLEEQGIPAYITSKTGYFSATEVQELLQVLRVLDNPRQDIPLYGVIKSLFGGFTEQEIAVIRGGHRSGTLYEALEAYAGEETPTDGALREKVSSFLEAIRGYRDLVPYTPIRELLQRLVSDYDYLNYITALPGGGKRRANVEMLFTKASDFERTSYFGLFHFVRYMEQLEKYDVDYGEADVLDENADVVRIMSIHKSKGLEFPVTFVAGLSKRFNTQDSSRSLIVDTDLGVAVDYVDPERRVRNKTLRRAVLARKLREDNLAEELRILYVALTRAREKLILTGTLKDAAQRLETEQTGAEHLSYLDYAEAASYLDFLMPVLNQTDLRVRVIGQQEPDEAQIAEQVRLYGKQSDLEQAGKRADPETLRQLKERFAFRYPHEELSRLYTKTTVSELKIAAMEEQDEGAYHAFESREQEAYIPRFRRGEEKIGGAVRGSAVHRVMELLDFGRLLSGQMEWQESFADYQKRLDAARLAADLDAFLREEVRSLRLTEEYFCAVDQRKIVQFFRSEPAWRMWGADRRGELHREQPFVLGISAGRLGADYPADEKVLIQGIIDVYFIENGKIVLLDYKTDVIESMEALWKRYAAQMDYYAEALEDLTGLPVGERLLYSFRLGVCGENR